MLLSLVSQKPNLLSIGVLAALCCGMTLLGVSAVYATRDYSKSTNSGFMESFYRTLSSFIRRMEKPT